MAAQLGGTSSLSGEEKVKASFQAIDKDQDGFISPAELKDMAANLGMEGTDEELQEKIREADTNGDGKISYEGKQGK